MSAYSPSTSTGLDSASPMSSDHGHPPITSPDDFTENEKALLAELVKLSHRCEPQDNLIPEQVQEELEKALAEMFEGGWHTGQTMPHRPVPTKPMEKEALILVGSLSKNVRGINARSDVEKIVRVPEQRKKGKPVYLVVYPDATHTAEWKWLDGKQQDLGGDDDVTYESNMDRVKAKALVLSKFSRLEKTHIEHHDRAFLIWIMRKYAIAWQDSNEQEGTRVPNLEILAESHFQNPKLTLLEELQAADNEDPAVARAASMEEESQLSPKENRKRLPS